MAVTIEQLLDASHADLALTVRAGRAGLERAITVPRIQKPGLALTGYTEQLHDGRLLIIGGTEVEFLSSVPRDAREVGIDTMMAALPAAVVVTRGLDPPPELAAACEIRGIPLIGSELATADFISRVTAFLYDQMAPQT